MATRKSHVLRKIANHELEVYFGELAVSTKNDLATSLVRQWISNAGTALIMTTAHDFWFHLTTPEAEKYQVVMDVNDGTFSKHLLRNRVPEAEIPSLLHELNVRQSTRCYNEDGEVLLLRVEPQEKKFSIELVSDRDV